ncbi:MAG: PAS domain S-box protein [Bacteroidales bacterium]|nr:PAS domain S-box protein [Bacteroidales bacterium]MBN2758705.1 PAS domain S-box protein [Bacteroidales bacterium]
MNKTLIISKLQTEFNEIIPFLKDSFNNFDFNQFEKIEDTVFLSEKKSVKIIIADIEFLKVIISKKLFKKAFKIAISNNIEKDNLLKIDAFIEKPIKKNEIFNLINLSKKIKENKSKSNSRNKANKNNLIYSEILNSTKNAFILLNEEKKVIEWNNSAERIFEVNKEDIIGKSYEDVIQNRTMKADLIDMINDNAQKNYSKEYLINIKSITGKKHRILWNITRLIDNKGNFKGILAIGQDVTEREKTEIERKRNEAKLKHNLLFVNTLLNNIPSPVYYKNKEDQYVGCNPEFANLFDLQKEEIIGKKTKDIVKPEHFAQEIINEDKQLFKTGKYQTKELIWKYKDGSTNNFLLKKTAFLNSDKSIAGLVGIMTAVTDIKVIEQKLRDSELFYKSITDSANDAIVLIDNKDQINFLNLAAEKIFKIDKKHALNKNIYQIIFNKNYKPEIDLHKKEILNIKTDKNKGVVFQLKAKNAKNIEFPIELSMSKISIREQIFHLLIIKDITERKIYEQKLLAAKEKAEESDRLKSAFLSNMSHEIRTPMNAIVGFSQLLTDKIFNDEKKKIFIEQININSESLMQLIEDIIYVSKIEAGKIEIKEAPCELNTILDEIKMSFEEHKRRMGKDNIELILSKGIDDKNLNITTDNQRFRQILTNLIGNALKFTEKGKVEFGYTKKSEKELLFFVFDTGLGINSKKIEYVFDRFTKVSASKTKLYGGTGLGLSITKDLVERLGGEISLESEENVGSKFYFTLPFNQNFPEKKNEKINELTDNTLLLKNKKILIAEDEEVNFLFLKEVIEPNGAEIDWAKNGKIAVELAKNHKYDIILMDIKMPVMDGYDAMKLIKKFSPEIPIIAQTAYAIPEEQKIGYEAGCDFYLSKPIEPNLLIKTIVNFIKH